MNTNQRLFLFLENKSVGDSFLLIKKKKHLKSISEGQALSQAQGRAE